MSKEKTKEPKIDITDKVIETMAKPKEIKFSKEQLVGSSKFIDKRDALSTILEDGKKYSMSECNTLLESFYNKKLEVK